MATALAARMLDATRPQPFATERFEAFQIYDRDGLRGSKGDLLPLCEGPTLEDCLQAACMRSVHKDKIAIRRTDAQTGAVVLHVYAIRQKSRASYVFADHETKRFHPLYAEHLHDIRLPVGEGL